MMHGDEKSDPAIVAAKPANEAVSAAEELVERRAGAKGNASGQRTPRTQGRVSVSQALERVRTAARERKAEKFTALLHHINDELLRDSFNAIQRKAAPGVDGVKWKDYAADLEANLTAPAGPYPSGRLPGAAVAEGLHPESGRQAAAVGGRGAGGQDRPAGGGHGARSASHEEDFLGFSYGFRPGRGPHDALDALAVAIETRKVNYILDADIQAFFDRVSHDWLIKFVMLKACLQHDEHRIADKRMLRLILKWLKVGVLEDGVVVPGELGTGQGSVISPLLANVYLHYAFDLWAEQWRRREAKGDMIIVRYADDIVVGFQHEADAKRFWDDMGRRLAEFALTLHPEKTRLIEFGRFAAGNRARHAGSMPSACGLGKPETFNFLGLRHICGRSRRGSFQLWRHTRRDRMRAKLKAVKVELLRRRHEPIPKLGLWLGQVVGGFFGYHAVPTNSSALSAFRYYVMDLWRRALRRRSQKDHFTWLRIDRLAADFLPKPLIRHPWPRTRFAANHPRWEPYALIGPVRLCAGGVR